MKIKWIVDLILSSCEFKVKLSKFARFLEMAKNMLFLIAFLAFYSISSVTTFTVVDSGSPQVRITNVVD